jgi:cyclophilin family peptidyl-prolyl cis-trans isomerase
MSLINSETARYCFLDLDLDDARSKLARGAAFVHATDTRYGFSSKDLRQLGGSELKRIPEIVETDHEWSSSQQPMQLRPPECGNRLIVELFWNVAPMTCENFATLCNNAQLSKIPLGESGKPLTYRGSVVHRIMPGFVLQGGDFVFGNGSGGESIFGKKFKDEKAGLAVKHDGAGILSMGNSGKNSNSSQFFLTLAATPQCDGKHVVFGRLLSGWDVLRAAEALGDKRTGIPRCSVTITECGIWNPFTPAAGYWYDQPDPESFSGIHPVFVARPRVVALAPTEQVLEKFSEVLSVCCSIVKLVTMEDETDGVEQLLQSLAVDLVVVAPAYQSHANSIALPDFWPPRPQEQTFIVTKPTAAVQAILEKSWVASAWILDGKPSG